MSSKISLYYSDEMHLYRECFLSDSLFLKFNKKDLKLELEFKLLDFLKIAKTFNFKELEAQALLTDQQIKEYCEKTVEERLKQKDSFAQLGFMIYGDIKLPEEEQVQKGFEYYVKKRDELKKWLDELNKININKLYFGLEHVVS